MSKKQNVSRIGSLVLDKVQMICRYFLPMIILTVSQPSLFRGMLWVNLLWP